MIEEVGVKDFMISNQFVSKIYAQVSEEPRVQAIYEDLFRPEGSEVHLKPLRRLSRGARPASACESWRRRRTRRRATASTSTRPRIASSA